MIASLRQFNKLVNATACPTPVSTKSAFDVAIAYLGADAESAWAPLSENVHFTLLSSSTKNIEPLAFTNSVGGMITIASFLSATSVDTRAHFGDDNDAELHAITAELAFVGFSVLLDDSGLEPRLTIANIIRGPSRSAALRIVNALALALSVYLIQRLMTNNPNANEHTKSLFSVAPRLMLFFVLDMRDGNNCTYEQYELHGDTTYWLSTVFGKRERGLGSYITTATKECPQDACPASPQQQHQQAPPREQRARDFSAMVKV